jgi:uncharacterized protein YkwD
MFARSIRVAAVLTAIAASLFAASLVVAPPAAAVGGTGRTMQAADALEGGVLQQINTLRAKHGLKPLRLNVKLRAAADTHSAAMAQFGFFTHESRDGGVFWKRVERFYKPSGYTFWSVGENLLWSSGDLTPAGALELWMNSPKHRENLLTARWREIGLSAVIVPAAGGIYNGLDVTIVTADFGVRRAA